jgi:hypothetical protein
MKQKGSISAPLRGMQRDNISSQIKPDSYILAVNMNSSNEVGGYVAQNEPSNYLAVQFPSTYKVVGFKNNTLNNRTYFFLCSVETDINSPNYRRSSIGYIQDSFFETFSGDTEGDECPDCHNPKNTLGTPLEQITQVPQTEYIELIHDRCISLADIEEKGLNFDINFPIKKIELKQEKLGTTLYWNDNRNYFRYLQIGRIEEALANNTFDYLHTLDIACDDPQEMSCLDVEKLLVNPKHVRIRLEADKEQVGGNLKQGTYEFWAAYCDGYGNETTEYSTPTNPISIWDENNYIQAQTETDDFTNFAIKIKVHNLDIKRFRYYKIAVVERNNVSNTQSVFLAGIYPTTDNIVAYTHSSSVSPNTTRGNVSIKTRMDMADLYAIKSQYKRMKGTMVSGDKLFGFGLEEEEEINLQPVVNLFSGLVKAQTSVANENLYKSAIATSKYKQYPRDEVQPLAIRFLYKDGGYSANFPLVGRPKDSEESQSFIQTSGSLKVGDKYIISNLNLGDSFANVGYISENTPFTATGTIPSSWGNSTVVTNITDENLASLLAGQSSCSENTRLEKWQIYNTAKELDTESCFDLNANSIQLPPEEVEKVCYVDVTTVIPTGTTTITDFEDFDGLENYINSNPSVVIPEITPYLLATYPETCTPKYIGNCDAPTLSSTINQIEEIMYAPGAPEYTPNYKVAGDYLKSVAPETCLIYKRNDDELGAYKEDLEIDPTLLPCYLLTRKKAYLRDSIFKNEVCAYSTSLPFQLDPSTSAAPVYLNYDASQTLNDLLVDNSNFSVSNYTLNTTPITMVVPNAFYNKLHNKAQFFNVKKDGRKEIVFEISKKSSCDSQNDAFASLNNTEVRYVIYDDCTSPTQIGGGLVDLNTPLLTVIDVTTFPENFIIALDTKITTQTTPTDCSDTQTNRPVYYVTPPCGCFGVYQRDPEVKSITVSWQSIKIRKKLEYIANCTSSIPKVSDCDPIPFKKYKMAYWESTVDYPDNKQLYDSSNLKIIQEDLNILSASDKADFIEYYTEGFNNNGTYRLKESTNLTCKPIRHPKFPDNTVAPFMIDNLSHKEGAESVIFPMGVNFDSKIVEAMLQVAYVNNLITKKQKEKIVGWEILKGDNSIHKSKTSSGILYDVYKYAKKEEEIHFSNFPFNDLGNNKFVKDPVTKKLIKHPYDGESNNKFTFISPDMLLTKPSIPTEMSLQGYMFGSAEIDFADVKKHPKWTVLGDKSYKTANTLAIAEVVLEAGVAIAGTDPGGGVPGVIKGLVQIAAMTLIYAAQGYLKFGQYRYNWLEIFRNLGRMDNFASFQYGVGKHNKFLKIENEDSNSIRKLSIKKHMRDGNFSFTDENDGKVTRFNHDLREHSVFLSTGDYPIVYPEDYKNFDNNLLNTKKSSNFLSSEVIEKNPRRNIANPYIYLKNYVPDQWGAVDSIKWLTTNYIFYLQEDTTCSVIYGGSEVISRFSYRIKVPFFLDNAINTPDKLPYIYSKNSNVGDAVYYCNYETADDILFEGGFKGIRAVYPDIKSDYNFDQTTGKSSFYLRPPSKFYLFTHGVVDFLVESEINCNFRYGKKAPTDQFYKNQNLQEWLQEVNLPMVEPNTFYYNNTYTFPTSNTVYKTLSRDYDREIWRKRGIRPNAYVWSEKDSEEDSLVDPYLIFKPLNFFEEGTDNGKLIDLRSIESGQFVGRYENTYQLFNPANPVADAINKQTGTGFLETRSTTFKKADLGFAGTQNTDFVSTPYGHFWADAKRGRVFQVDQNGGNMEIISDAIQGQPSGMKQWFREHLPFKILKQFPQIDIDNKFKGLGMNIWYDDRQSRIFVTKRDYIAINTSCLKYEEGLGFYEDCTETASSCPTDYTYNELTGKCELIADSPNLCPPGYTYSAELKTCTLVETIPAECVCTANVTASGQTICSGTSTSITLSTTSLDSVSFSWTVVQTGVTGASAGTGNTISQTLSGNGTAVYTVTPKEVVSQCNGTPITITVTVNPIPNVIATPSSLIIDSGSSANITLSSSFVGTTFAWTVVQSGVTGATSGTGSTISQVLAGEGTATYTITPINNGCTGNPINAVVTVAGLVISNNTKINIWFDNSGSMDSTLSPLQVMASTILKPCLLPAYNNDSALYDSRVQVLNFAVSERYINLLTRTSTDPTITKVINLTFADESNTYGAEATYGGTITPNAASDINLLRTTLATEPVNSLVGAVFQVATGGVPTPSYPGFKTFVTNVHTGVAPFTGTSGLADKTEIGYVLDVIPGSTPQYYANLIIAALNNLGFSLTPC